VQDRGASVGFRVFVVVLGLVAIAMFFKLRTEPGGVMKVFVVYASVVLIAALVEHHRGRRDS
jgi:hypothetical protein